MPIRTNGRRRNRKLDDEDVRHIKKLLRDSDASMAEIGDMYGVSNTLVWMINHEQVYKDVSIEESE